jgi:hypothetical protein
MTKHNISPVPFLFALLMLFLFFLIALPAIFGSEYDCEDYNATEIAGSCVLPPQDREVIIVIVS